MRRLCGLGRRGRRGSFFSFMVRFPRMINCGRMLIKSKCRRRILRRSPHIHARFLAIRPAQPRETRVRSWVCCFELLYVFPFYSHLPVPFPSLTEPDSTLPGINLPNPTPPSLHSTRPPHLNRHTPQQHPHHRRLRRREPRSRTTLPPSPPFPLHRLLRVSTTDHKQPPPCPTRGHIPNVPLGKLHQHRPFPRPKHTTRHIRLTRPPGAGRTRHRLPYTPIPTGVRRATQSSLGLV